MVPADQLDPNVADSVYLRDDVAVQMPNTFCAFQGCCWAGCHTSELYEHLAGTEKHKDILEAVVKLMPKLFAKEEKQALASAYHEASAVQMRQSAPHASYSQDPCKTIFPYIVF